LSVRKRQKIYFSREFAPAPPGQKWTKKKRRTLAAQKNPFLFLAPKELATKGHGKKRRATVKTKIVNYLQKKPIKI